MATLGTPLHSASITAGGHWQLQAPMDAFSQERGRGLATQIATGRCLRVLEASAQRPGLPEGRLRVRLAEDGYPCWVEPSDLRARGLPTGPPILRPLEPASIEGRLEQVISFALAALAQPNIYLWGGTLGPDFDCSGVIQSAFAQAGIWLPRDAYLQERFCRPVAVQPGATSLLRRGDLIFFGPAQRCTHVGLHLGGGRYLHSSGRAHGRNGLGIDDLHPHNRDPVACHYRAELRGAGRVMHSHDGSPLPS
jgi:cell wall-associated NlpC family hydrolase